MEINHSVQWADLLCPSTQREELHFLPVVLSLALPYQERVWWIASSQRRLSAAVLEGKGSEDLSDLKSLKVPWIVLWSCLPFSIGSGQVLGKLASEDSSGEETKPGICEYLCPLSFLEESVEPEIFMKVWIVFLLYMLSSVSSTAVVVLFHPVIFTASSSVFLAIFSFQEVVGTTRSRESAELLLG